MGAFIAEITGWAPPLSVELIDSVNRCELRHEKGLRVRDTINRRIQRTYATAGKTEGSEILSSGRDAPAPLKTPSHVNGVYSWNIQQAHEN
jgi:hypothetical protein